MSARTDTIREAVVELRERLKVDQTTFARMLGKSYPMARRYETDVPPQGEALAPFALLAAESQYPDLAEVFRTALIEDLPDVTKALAETSGHIKLEVKCETAISIFPSPLKSPVSIAQHTGPIAIYCGIRKEGD